MINKIYYLILAYLASIITGILVYRSIINFKFSRYKLDEMKNRILGRKEPKNIEEARLYEFILEKNKNRPLQAWGTYLLLKYYKDNYDMDKEILAKSIQYAEKIRKEFKEYTFYEDTLFALGNIYFFEICDFNMACEIYKKLIEEKKHTRWKNVCEDRIALIKSSVFDENALKLYVNAEKYFEARKLEDAEFFLNEILKRYPKTEISAAAMFFLGDINYYKYNDLDNALKFYKMTYDKFPLNSLAQTSLYKTGEILRKIKHWEEAIETYKEYASKYKNSPYKDDAFYYIGECYYKMGKLRQAKNSFNLILGDYPHSKWTDVIYHKLQEINGVLMGEIN